MNRTYALSLLLFAPCTACGTSAEPGVEVRFVSLPVALSSPSPQEGTAGQQVSLEATEWTTAEVELLPCTTALNVVMDWLVPNAYAHGAASPTRLAIPTVERASATDEVLLGSIEPPAGRYCGVSYRLDAADDDAQGLEESPDMLGRSFAARGRFAMDGAEPADFEVVSARPRTEEYPLEFELSESHRQVTLAIGHHSERWFAGVDLTASASEREAELVESFLAAVEIVER